MDLNRISALISVLLCGALYSAGIFAAGLVYSAPWAVGLSIATVAAGYIGSTLNGLAYDGLRVRPSFIAAFLYAGIAFAATSAIALFMGI